jgi:large-conductance mechanosensitive channel
MYQISINESFNMLSLLLIMSFIRIEATILPRDLEQLENLWLDSQVLMYYNSKPSQDLKTEEPICFGNLLTMKYVITAASCFMNVEDILKYSEKHDKKPPTEADENLIISRSIKKDLKIDKIHIIKLSM